MRYTVSGKNHPQNIDISARTSPTPPASAFKKKKRLEPGRVVDIEFLYY
jgi:hypothetical protein